jgi:hypothetical protein
MLASLPPALCIDSLSVSAASSISALRGMRYGSFVTPGGVVQASPLATQEAVRASALQESMLVALLLAYGGLRRCGLPVTSVADTARVQAPPAFGGSPMSYRIPLSSGSKENSSGRPGMEAQNKTIAPAQTGRLCAGATTDLTREMTCRGAPAVGSANLGAAALDQKQQDDHGQDAAYDPNDSYVIHFASPFLMGKNFFERLGHNDGFGPQSHQENGRKYEEDQRKYQLHRGLRRLLFHLLAALSS